MDIHVPPKVERPVLNRSTHGYEICYDVKRLAIAAKIQSAAGNVNILVRWQSIGDTQNQRPGFEISSAGVIAAGDADRGFFWNLFSLRHRCRKRPCALERVILDGIEDDHPGGTYGRR